MQAETALELVDVHRSFGAVKALAGCSFQVSTGSVTGLIGPNGSGKTTLFDCISGILKPDRGDIRLNGESILSHPPHAIARAGVGRTFQTTRVFSNLTVGQNISAAAQINRRSTADSGRRFLELFHLERFLSTPAGKLSYGQQKLVELASVMACTPSLILLDEPASGVSRQFLSRLAEYIRQLRSASRTILIVEHNMEFVFEICERIVVMDGGTTIADGPADEIRRDSKVLEAYLGVPNAS
jgi:ABC-type branched-subunit amino acid transport system ATPase component